MTQTYNEDVIINDNLEVNGVSDEVQVSVKGASTQTEALQQWKNNGGTVLSEIDENGHLIVGSQDGTIDALLEAHNIEDSNKPSRGLHSKGILTGTLSNLVSWVVSELGLKGTGGLSALHRALRVQATNENTGAMASGADVRAGDFEATNIGGNVTTNNLEMSALVAKVNNQSGATLKNAYGLKVEMIDDGDSDNVYAIYTDKGIVYLGDVLELADNAVQAPLKITRRSVAPTSPSENERYFDDGTNTESGLPGDRVYIGGQWVDIGGGSENVTDIDEYSEAVSLSDREIVYLGSSDQWDKVDSDATSPVKVGRVIGVVADASTTTVRVFGKLDGFSGLTVGEPVYAGMTAGGYTQTKPVVSDGGGQIAIVEIGYAISATEIFIDPKPIVFAIRDTVSASGTLEVEHYSDPPTRTRKPSASLASTITGVTLAEYGSVNQDTDFALRNQTPATYGSDLTGSATITSSSEGGTNVDDRAVDDNSSTYWKSNIDISDEDAWIQATWGDAKTISQYTIQCDSLAASRPTDFTLEYYDGATWQVADTQSGLSWSSLETKTFNVSVPYNSTQWRLYFTAVASSNTKVRIREWEMMETATFNDGYDRIEQGIQVSGTQTTETVQLWLKKVGSPTDTLTVQLFTDSSGDPDSIANANLTADVDASTLGTDYGWITFTFATPTSISGSTQYHIVLSTDGSPSETDYVVWGGDSSSPSYGDGVAQSEESSVWSSLGADMIFRLQGEATRYDTVFDNGTIDFADNSGANDDTFTTLTNNELTSEDLTLQVVL